MTRGSEHRQHGHGSGRPPAVRDELPGLLRSVGSDLVEILVQTGTPELFRQDTSVPLDAVGEGGPLVVVSGHLCLDRILLGGEPLPLAALFPGDILCPTALHPIVRSNAVLVAATETMAYTVSPEQLIALRIRRPDLATALDRQVNHLLRRLLDEAESLLQSLRYQPE
jgi:hypothetical protein